MLKKIVLTAAVVSTIVSVAPAAFANGSCEPGLPGCETPEPQRVPESSALAGLLLCGGFVAQNIIRNRQRQG